MAALEKNAAVIVESLARVVYNVSDEGLLGGELRVEPEALKSALRLLSTPRAATLLAAPAVG